MKFTPGPWSVYQHNTFHYIVSDSGYPVAMTQDIISTDDNRSTDINQNEINAHLIAVAPEMYEALEDVLYCEIPGCQSEKIIKVLQKARGE